MQAGTFHTEYHSKEQLSLPESSDEKLTKYVNDSTTDFNYDMIIGLDLLKELGIMLSFGSEVMIWQNIVIPMTDPQYDERAVSHTRGLHQFRTPLGTQHIGW